MYHEHGRALHARRSVLAIALALVMILTILPVSAFAAESTVSLLTTEITPETTSLEIEIHDLPSSGILRVVDLGSDASYDSSKLNTYTSYNFTLVSDLSEGKNELALTAAPTAGSRLVVVLRDATDGIVDYLSDVVTVTSDGSQGGGEETKTPEQILANCSVGLYKDGEIRTDKFTEDETSVDVKVKLDDSVGECYLILYTYPGNAAFDPDNESVSKRLWAGLVTDGYSGTLQFNSNIELKPGYKIIAHLNVPVGEDYYRSSDSQALEIVDANGVGFEDYDYPDIFIDEDTLEAGATSFHITMTGDDRLFEAAREGKTGIYYSIHMYEDGKEFDFEDNAQISLVSHVPVTEAFAGQEVTFTEPLREGCRVRAVVFWEQNVEISLPKGNDYEPMFGKPDDSVLISAASNEPKIALPAAIYAGDTSCEVTLSGAVDGLMMSVKSYPAGTEDPQYDSGTIQKFLTSVSAGANTVEFGNADTLTEGTVIRAFLISAGEPVAASAPVTVTNAPLPVIVVKGKVYPETTVIPVEITGKVPAGAKAMIFSFGADVTSYERDYTRGKVVAPLTDVTAGTTRITLNDSAELAAGQKLVVFLLDSNYEDLTQSEPVEVTDKSSEPSVSLGGIDTASTTVDVTIEGTLPDGTMLLVKSYASDAVSYAYDSGQPQGVIQASDLTAGTVTHTLTNADLLRPGHKVVAFLLNGGSPIASSEPVEVVQGALATPEVSILTSKITAGMTRMDVKYSFDAAIDSAKFTVYKYTGDSFDKSSATELGSQIVYRSETRTFVGLTGKIAADDKLIVVLTVNGEDTVSEPVTVLPSPDWAAPSIAFGVDSIADTATEIPLKIDYPDEYTEMDDFYCNVSVYMFDSAVDDDVFAEDEYWENTNKAVCVATANASAGDDTRGSFNIKVLSSANLTAGKKLIIKVRLPHKEWEGEEEDFVAAKSILIEPSSRFAQGPSVLLYNVDLTTERGKTIKSLLDDNDIIYKVAGNTDLNQKIGYLIEKKGYEKNETAYTGNGYNTEFLLMNAADSKVMDDAFLADDTGLVDKMTAAGVSIPHKAIVTTTNQEWTLSELIERITEEHEVMTSWIDLYNLAQKAEGYTEDKYGQSENWQAFTEALAAAKDLLALDEDEIDAEALQLAYQKLNDELSALTRTIADAAVTGIAAQTYTGKAFEPTPIVKLDGVTLVKDTDYTVSYEHNTNAGTATVTIAGKDSYTGTVTKTFEINPKKLTQTVTLSKTSYPYNGKVKTPAVTVKDGSTTLKASDYTVTYASGRKNVGTYKVTVRLKGNYSGTISKVFKISKAANPLTIKAKTAAVKYSKLKKKTQTLAVTKLIKFTKKLNDKKTYTLVSAKKGSKSFKKYFKINKTTGKLTVKKGLKKGTYKVKVKVKAAGNANYKPSALKTVTFKIKVK